MSIETGVALGLKLLAMVGLGVYVIFALVMVRQEHLMAHVLEESFEPVLRGLVIIHLIAAVVVLLAALFFL